MAAKKVNEAQAKLWTGTIRMELKGTIDFIAVRAFSSIVGGAEAREKALKRMQELHEHLKEEGR